MGWEEVCVRAQSGNKNKKKSVPYSLVSFNTGTKSSWQNDECIYICNFFILHNFTLCLINILLLPVLKTF